MKLINNSTRNYIAYGTVLEVGKVLEVADEKTVKVLLNQKGVEEYVDKEEVKKLKEENKKLKEAEAKADEELKAKLRKNIEKQAKKEKRDFAEGDLEREVEEAFKKAKAKNKN